MSAMTGSAMTGESNQRTLGALADVVWGTKAGVTLGAFFAALRLVATLLGGVSGGPSSRALERAEGPAWLLALILLGGGALGGAIVGLFRPLTETVLGSIVLGVAVAIPMALATDYVQGRIPYPAQPLNWAAILIYSTIVGGGVGAAIRLVVPRRSRRAA